jgi:hypothetical protein
MMGNTPEYRLMTQAYSYKKIRITQCDPATGYIEGRDSANQQIQVTFAFFQSPYVQVPKIGESWLVTKLDNNWVIHSRFEETNETFPVGSLIGGDVRINAPSRLFLNPAEELICDFNKARNSFAELETAIIPGSALYGSATLDQVNVGTVNVVDKIITPLSTFLPTYGVIDGQEERVLITEDDIVWSFRYREDAPTDYNWDFIGGPEYMSFRSGTVSTTGGTGWVNTSGTPVLTVPYDGDYIISGGAEAESASNNVEYELGLSVNGTVLAFLPGYIAKSNQAFTTSTSYKLDANTIELSKGDILREVYRSESSDIIHFDLGWMKMHPIRVKADPNDDTEPVVIFEYNGGG